MTRELTFSTSTWNHIIDAAHVGLRILANGFAATSVVTMLTSNQEIYMMDNIAIAKAHYSYSSALRYKLIADALGCFFSLLSSVLVYRKTKCSHTEPKTSFYFNLLIADVVCLKLKTVSKRRFFFQTIGYKEKKMID
ncbi:putative casparian strip membrane protein [Helianthus anomalus]